MKTLNFSLVFNSIDICTYAGYIDNPLEYARLYLDGTMQMWIDAEDSKGPEVSKMFDVVSDYRYIFVSRNYVFYRIEDKYIRIINLYHEKEDFMWQLFGIDTTHQDTIDYWDE